MERWHASNAAGDGAKVQENTETARAMVFCGCHVMLEVNSFVAESVCWLNKLSVGCTGEAGEVGSHIVVRNRMADTQCDWLLKDLW